MSPPTLAIWIVAGIAAWILLWMWFIPVATRRIRSTLDARIGDGPLVGAIDLASCCYCRWVHRVRFEGFDRLPETFRHGGAGGGVGDDAGCLRRRCSGAAVRHHPARHD